MEQPGAIRPRLEVTTPVFEGPLELLLALAEREEIDIFQVSLAALTDAYLAEIARLERGDPREMAEFLWLAARLLLLKSVRLLPGERPEDEESELLGWEEDVRARLREYRIYREMAERLMQRAAAEPFSFPPPSRALPVEGQEDPLQLEALVAAFQAVLSRLPPRPLVYVGTGWTLEDKLEALERRLEAGPFDLLDVILACADRLEAVVTFVAVLELLRRGRIRVHQPHNFGRIMVEAA
ncbi:MAG TPA: segregation/condensation protein A [Candidatus Dormibacteraeota bacterium]|jgi:segregation and condensation protein A|nr:segregation/condensation protein A [Candidatus Dormibacteraeota bacterium]